MSNCSLRGRCSRSRVAVVKAVKVAVAKEEMAVAAAVAGTLRRGCAKKDMARHRGAGFY